MMSRIGDHIDFPNCDAEELVEISEVMARDLEYDIDEDAQPVFKDYISRGTDLPFFSNTRTVRNAMDRTRMNAAIRTFEKFAIQGENGGICTVKEDFQVLVDDIVNADASKRTFAQECGLIG